MPLPLQWVFAAFLFGGLVAAFALRRRSWRRAALALAVAGLAGSVAAVVLGGDPGPPPYELRIASPPNGARVASPLVVTVCGVRADGSTLPPTDSQHYLVVTVDGHEVATVDAPTFPQQLSDGTHTLRVELVTPAHHAFNPPAVATSTVTIAAAAPGSPGASC